MQKMLFNQRKKQTLEYFSRREWVRPAQWAIDLRLYPIRSSYKYLRRLQRKLGLLRRGYDITGHLVYRLSPRGARWLLRNRNRV